MPFHVIHDGELTVNMTLLRVYLRNTFADTGDQVLDDAFWAREPGALGLVEYLLLVRGNRRSRRSIHAVEAEWRRVRHGGDDVVPARWFTTLTAHVLGHYRQLRKFGYPMLQAPTSRSLTDRLRRSTRRTLAFTGAVEVDLPTLASRALEAVSAVMNALPQQQVVLWVDNWFLERYGTNPARPVNSTDVTAMAVLFLSTKEDTPSQATRSHRIPAFPGHLTLHRMTIHLDNVAADLWDNLDSLSAKVTELMQFPLEASHIRVPLDVRRARKRSLQWRAFSLTENRLSTNRELMDVLQDVRAVQQHVGRDLVLLVDEKVHYAVMRVLHSQPFTTYDAHRWMERVPMVYGAWHAYKHTLTIVHRQFFQIFALLEMTGSPALGSTIRCQRKVLYMEKVFATLLLLGTTVRHQLEGALQRHPAGRTRACSYHLADA
jgi:hypothetical protein